MRRRDRRPRWRGWTNTLTLDPLEDRTLLSFSAPVSYPVGEVPWSVAVGDFNGDGIPDLVAANLGKFPADPGQAISVLLGNGDGTFGTETRFGTGRNPYAVVVGDFNGDGIQDLAVANYFSGSVSVLLGNGDGTFQPATDYDVGSLPRALAVGDFNGDGIADLVVANYVDSTVSVLIGNGDGSFVKAVSIPVNGSPAAVTTADLSGNGLDDIIVTDDSNGAVEVLRSNGDGSFQPPVNYAVGATPRSVVAADLNGDGVPDLVTVNQDGNNVSVLLGNGDGTFQSAVNYAVADSPSQGPISVTVADFNADNIPDLAVANLYSTPGAVSVLLGNGDGTFQSPVTFDAGPYPSAVVAGDFNGDGYPDLAVTEGLDPSGMIGILTNQGDWSAPHTSVRPAKNPSTRRSEQLPPPPQGQYPDNVLVNNPAEDGTSREDTQSETTLAVAGDTVLAAYQDSFSLTLNPPQFDGFSTSTDGGQTFTDGGALPRNTYGDLGDPVLARDAQTGRTYLATLSAGPLNVWRSDDNLQTLMSPVNASPGRGAIDKEWLTVDNFPGPGQGNVYLVTHAQGNPDHLYLFHSTDQGATFGPTNGVQIAAGSVNSLGGCWVTVGPDHAVYVFWFDATSSPHSIKMARSTDEGQTFGTPVTVATLRTTGASGDLGLGGFRTNAFPQAVVNPVTNQLYLVYDDKGQGTDRADVYFQQSNDGGATWSPPVSIIDDTSGADHWQPAIAVTPDGTKVGVFWYDRRVDPAHVLIDRFGSIGQVTADGVTFGPNFRITDTSFPPEFGHDPLVPSNYMGDYDQAVADNNYFYLTWGDNRLPSLGHTGNNADVRFAQIPAAGPSVVSLVSNTKPHKPATSVRITFNEPIDAGTFTPDQVDSFTDPAGNPIVVTSISPVDGSNDTQFDLFFDTQTLPGTYTMTIGPNILDCYGNPMAQPFTGSFVILAGGGGHQHGSVEDVDVFGVLVALVPKKNATWLEG